MIELSNLILFFFVKITILYRFHAVSGKWMLGWTNFQFSANLYASPQATHFNYPHPLISPNQQICCPNFFMFPIPLLCRSIFAVKNITIAQCERVTIISVSNGRKKEANAIKTYKMGNYLLEWTVCSVFPRHQCDWQWIYFKSKDLPALTLVGPTRQKHHTAPPRCTKPPQPTRFDSFNIIASGGLYSVILHHN